MSLSLSLTNYVEENKADLITKAILGGKTMGMVDVRYGIKSSEKIPVLESTAPFQAASSCGFTSSGTTSITQIQISTNPIAVAEQICLRDLEAYYTQKYLPQGANYDSTTIAAEIVNRKVANIAFSVEQAIWQGKTTETNSTVLKALNGWLATIDSAGTAINATQQSAINASTVMGIFEDIYTKVPAAAIYNEPVIAFCGMDTFRTLLNKITSLYGFYGNYTTDAAANRWELVYPGTNMKVVAVAGLNADNPVDTSVLGLYAKNRIIATYASNLVIGTDLGTDMTQMDAWFSKDDQVMKFYTRFRLGCAVKFGDHVVQYKNTGT
jgi:hypothetical protein